MRVWVALCGMRDFGRQRLTRLLKWWATTFPFQHGLLCPLSVQLRLRSVLFLSLFCLADFCRVFSTCVLLCCDFRLQFPPHKHTKDTLVLEDAWVFSFLVTVHRKIKQTYGEKKRVLTQDWVVHLFSLNLKWVLLVELSGSDDCCSVIHFKECPFFYFCPFWQAGNKIKKYHYPILSSVMFSVKQRWNTKLNFVQ